MYGIMSIELRWAFNALAWKPTKQQLLTALSGISQEENERIQKFHFREDYKLSLAGRLMIRKCINSFLKLPWKEIKLKRSEKGKPELANTIEDATALYFNISHHGNYTVLAASSLHNIGVDVIKYVRPNNTDIPSFFKLMKRQFVDAEWSYVYSFKNEWTQLKAFYRLWCLKESYVKAIGTGIGTNSAEHMRFDIHTKSLDEKNQMCSDSKLCIKDVHVNWSFNEYVLDDEHIVAVATDTYEPIISNDFKLLTYEDLCSSIEPVISVDVRWWEHYQLKRYKEK